ncbi:uncharacterized protein LOC144077699 [Stigmatopora argus]
MSSGRWTKETSMVLRDCFETTDWEVLCNSHGKDIDSVTHCITDYINFCVENIVPSKKVRCFSNSKPWVTRDLRALLKKRAFRSCQERLGARFPPAELLRARKRRRRAGAPGRGARRRRERFSGAPGRGGRRRRERLSGAPGRGGWRRRERLSSGPPGRGKAPDDRSKILLSVMGRGLGQHLKDQRGGPPDRLLPLLSKCRRGRPPDRPRPRLISGRRGRPPIRPLPRLVTGRRGRPPDWPLPRLVTGRRGRPPDRPLPRLFTGWRGRPPDDDNGSRPRSAPRTTISLSWIVTFAVDSTTYSSGIDLPAHE